MKIYLTVTIKAKPEHQEYIKSTLSNLVAQTQAEPAAELYVLHQGVDEPHIFTFYEIWSSQEGLDAHNQQAYILELGDLIAGKLLEEPIIIKTSLVAKHGI